jgi:hypothetical protein
MAYSFYIYYRIDPARAAVCVPRIRELLAAVGKATGVRGRLLTKRGEPGLWMEIYDGVTDEANFEWELAEAAGRLGIQEFLQVGTTRHVECFQES